MLLKIQDTHENTTFLSSEETVAVQWEDSGPWMHVTVVSYRSDDNNCRNYKIWATKMGCVITRIKRHVKPTLIQAEEYPRKEMEKSGVIGGWEIWWTSKYLASSTWNPGAYM